MRVDGNTGIEIGTFNRLVAAAVDAAGDYSFARPFRGMLGKAPLDLCSAFYFDLEGNVERLLFVGNRKGKRVFLDGPQGAEGRSELRKIVATQKLNAATATGLSVVTSSRPLSRIGAYRRWWFEKPRVVERISIHRMIGSRCVVASAYRIEPSGPFSPLELERFAAIAPVLMALVAKHASLAKGEVRSNRYWPRPDELAGNLAARLGLSGREAEICAHLLLFRSQTKISEATGLSINTVATYRKRAYEKLNIGSRRQLLERFDAFASRPNAAHANPERTDLFK
jgi:LuxR family transcriptional regulator, activator of tox operons